MTVFLGAAYGIPESKDQRITVELFAEAPQIKHPTGLSIDKNGRVYVIESHTHFPPEGYAGPEGDKIYVFSGKEEDGRTSRRTIFAEGLKMGMDLLMAEDGWLYVAERSRISRLRDSNGDLRADEQELLIDLQTTGSYPHNGLSGLCFDALGHLYFGLGENLGHPYTMVDRDGIRIKGAKGAGGGVFRCSRNGKQLKQIARGFWNPFGVWVDEFGRILAVDNDPSARPPCRLLHVVPGGDYGYQFQFGRSGIHPFLAWDGELSNTLPMVCGVGEGPCEIIHFNSPAFPKEYRGEYLVTSWGDHRVERYRLEQHGISIRGKMEPLVQGGDSFRPVSMAMAPDGTLYITDWGSRLYNLHGEGKIWRIRPKTLVLGKQKPLPRPPYVSQSQERRDRLQKSKNLEELLTAAKNRDPFIRNAAIIGLAHNFNDVDPSVYKNPEHRIALILAFKENKDHGRLKEFLGDDNPDTRFEVLRWIADYKLDQHRDFVMERLKKGDFDYRLFRAHIACLDSLDSIKKPDGVNTRLALSLLNDQQPADHLRAHLVRYLSGQKNAIKQDSLIKWTSSNDPSLRKIAVEMLRFHPGESSRKQLARIAKDSDQPQELRLAAITSLSAGTHGSGTLMTLAKEKDHQLRSEALRSLIGTELEKPQVNSLKDVAIRHPDSKPLVRRVLGQPFTDRLPPPDHDTNAWLQRIDSVPEKANPETGQLIFFNKKIALCSNCHQVAEQGTRVGPDLTLIGRNISRQRLLESILQPSKELAPHYRPWTITMDDNSIHTGIALRRGGNAEVYLGIDGTEIRLDKRKIKDKQVSHVSLMPAGLAHTLTLPELRDLLAFLMENR
jgi:putative membrane-bound dehydrogenase-like protein